MLEENCEDSGSATTDGLSSNSCSPDVSRSFAPTPTHFLGIAITKESKAVFERKIEYYNLAVRSNQLTFTLAQQSDTLQSLPLDNTANKQTIAAEEVSHPAVARNNVDSWSKHVRKIIISTLYCMVIPTEAI
jgi:hypothetical protein